MAASFFNADAIKILRDKLKFFSGSVISTNGSVDPKVTATDGKPGDLYIRSSGEFYKKMDTGVTINWELIPVAAELVNYVQNLSTSTDNNVPRFDLATGKLIQGSALSIDDAGLAVGLDQVQVSRDAVTTLELVTLQQLQAYSGGVRSIIPARAATTSNITLSGTQTVDTVALAVSDVVLVKNQTLQTENGAYDVSAGAWSRSIDANTGAKLEQLLVTIGQGTQENTGWYQQTDNVVIGVSNLIFAQFFGAGSYTADGLGLELNGSTFSLELDSTTLSKSATGLRVAAGGITNAEINAAAAIAYSKLALSNSIVNADINAAAAIAYSKLAPLTSGNILVGNASNIATPVAASGDVTISNAGVTAITTNAVINANLAQMPANTFKANNTGSTANAVDITGTQATVLLDVFTSTLKGLVPASGGGIVNFLRADGTFAVPSASGITSLTGEATATGPGAAAVTLTTTAVTGKALTGYVSGAGTIADTDSILQAIQKLNGNDADLQLVATLTTKGDMYVATGASTVVRQGVGTNGFSLIADSAQTTGVRWANAQILQVVSVSSDVTLTANAVHLVSTGSPRSLTLPSSPAVGTFLHIKDISLNASLSNITIVRAASESIENVAANFVMDMEGQCIQLVADTSGNWWVI